MFKVLIIDPKGKETQETIMGTSALLGKGRDCDIKLDSWRVGREHARIFRTKAGMFIQDLGQFTGTNVNDDRIEQQYGPLNPEDEISLAGFVLKVIDSLAEQAELEKKVQKEAEKAEAEHIQKTQGSDNSNDPAFNTWRRKIHEQLLETIDLRRRDMNRMNDTELRVETEKLLRELISHEPDIPESINKDKLIQNVLHEAVGLGPLEELIADESVTEIMINRYDEIYLERQGKLMRHPTFFTSDRAVLGVIERIVAPLGRRIDESSPMVDARLKDGSRVNAIIPPLALKGPTLTIRKFAKRALSANDLVNYGSMSEEMSLFLELCVKQRKNVIVSGGTGSGKTTLLNVLSNFIPDGERIITIEDAAELKLNHSHLISLESRPPNAEGRGQVSIRDLVKNSLRMRPDRIVVGECRGGEALDMLQVMNTGHEGSLTTLHANSPRDALARLETLVLMAGMDLPLSAIRDQVASAIDVIVQQTRLVDGRRIINGVTEVTGMESSKIQIQEIFRFEDHGRDANGKCHGLFTGCGAVPSFFEELRETGVAVDLRWFERIDSKKHNPHD